MPPPPTRHQRLLRLAGVGIAGGMALVLALLVASRGTVLFEGHGRFGTVRVVESRDGLRALHFGTSRNRQTALYLDRPLHLELPYTRVGMLGPALAPADGRLLFIGLGGGAMPTATRLLRPYATIDVVEIDPLVVEVAGRYFGFTPGAAMTVHTGDGRAFLENAGGQVWDLILLDAFSADSAIPLALTTLEFLETVRARLAPGGVVVANVPTAQPLSSPMLSTYLAAFPEVHRVDVPWRRQAIVVAGAGDRNLGVEELAAAAARLAAPDTLEFDLEALVRSGYRGAPAGEGRVLRDP
jgi:spermidine synthase